MGSMREMLEEEQALDKVMIEGSKAGLSIEGVNTEEKTTHTPEDNTQTKNDPQKQTKSDEWEEKYKVMEHKYNVLKGKEYSEVPRLQAENKELKNKIDQLEKSIDEVKKDKEQRQSAAKSAEMDEVFESLTQELGENAVNSIKRILTTDHSASQIEALKKQLADNEGKIVRLEQETTKVQKNSFVEKLKALVPDWETINSDPSWLNWLDGRVPGSRMTYQDALNDASQNGDVGVVAEVFNTFKTTKTPKPKNSKAGIEDLLEPGQARSQTPEGGNEKKVYTTREIDRIYKQISRGVYSDKKARELEADIDLAYQEGRIQES